MMFHLVFYTDFLIPSRFAACNRGPVIFIRPKHRNDAGLLAHEIMHVKQWWRNPAFGLFYRFSKQFRLEAEVEAYREQLRHYDTDQSDLFAQYLVEKYDLDIGLAEAQQLLKQP
jgi:hypothetical protein